jgi:hypothetical protein
MNKQEAASIRKRREALGIGRKKAADAAGISLYRAYRIEVKAEPAEETDLTTYLDTLKKLDAQAKGKATAAKRPAEEKAQPKKAQPKARPKTDTTQQRVAGEVAA